MANVKQPRVFNVFYGDETYLLERELRRATKWPNRSVMLLDGAEVTEVAIVEAMGDSVLGESDGTVVIVDNADQVKLSGLLVGYAAARDAHDKSSILVALFHGATLSKGWAEVAKSGRAIPFMKLKPWEKEKIQARVNSEVAALSLKLEDDAFDLLFMLHGEQTASVVNEVKKAAYLVEKGAPISKVAVSAVCDRKHSAMPWAVSEAAFAKDSKRALLLLAMLVEDRGDEVLVPIVASLMKQLETFLILRHMLDQQASLETMGAALGIHPYRVQKDLPSVKKHTVPELLKQMKKLCDLEVDVKGPATAKRTRVELAVLSLAA